MTSLQDLQAMFEDINIRHEQLGEALERFGRRCIRYGRQFSSAGPARTESSLEPSTSNIASPVESKDKGKGRALEVEEEEQGGQGTPIESRSERSKDSKHPFEKPDTAQTTTEGKQRVQTTNDTHNPKKRKLSLHENELTIAPTRDEQEYFHIPRDFASTRSFLPRLIEPDEWVQFTGSPGERPRSPSIPDTDSPQETAKGSDTSFESSSDLDSRSVDQSFSSGTRESRSSTADSDSSQGTTKDSDIPFESYPDSDSHPTNGSFSSGTKQSRSSSIAESDSPKETAEDGDNSFENYSDPDSRLTNQSFDSEAKKSTSSSIAESDSPQDTVEGEDTPLEGFSNSGSLPTYQSFNSGTQQFGSPSITKSAILEETAEELYSSFARDGKKDECLVCLERTQEDMLDILGCHHIYCWNCLEQLITIAMNDEASFPPRCCDKEILIDVVEILYPTIYENYLMKKEEYSTKNRVYCFISTCNAFIPARDISGSDALCHACDRTTCTHCKYEKHFGDCLEDEELQLTLATAAKMGCIRCKGCKALIEKREGCNQVRCQCGLEWCYACNERYKQCACMSKGTIVRTAQDLAVPPWWSQDDIDV